MYVLGRYTGQQVLECHSSCSLSYTRSTAPSKASSPHSVLQCFLFQSPVPSLFLKVMRQQLTSSSSSSIISILPSMFPAITCFRRQFLCTVWPIQLSFLHFTVRTIFLSSLTPCNTLSLLTRSVQLISVLLQHHISKLSEVSTFQHHKSYAPNIALQQFPQ